MLARAHATASLVLAGSLLQTGCGDPSPRVLAANEPAREGVGELPVRPDETTKIERLINTTRASGAVFLRQNRELTAGEFGDHLRTTWDRHGGEIDTARELVERATRPGPSGRPLMVRTGDAKPYTVRDWLHGRLDEIETGAAPGTLQTRRTPTPVRREVTISDVLLIIERSGHEFVMPQRKGRDKIVDARAFADKLQQKWQWLGKDIEEVDSFLREIATESFGAFKPYRVRLADGTEENVRPWLSRQLEAKRRALSAAEVGGP